MTKPAAGMSGRSQRTGSINSMPSFFNSSAIAPKMECALRSFNFISSASARRSGLTSNRFRGAICPSMTHRATPRSLKAAIILDNCPTLTQTISSTFWASAGSVSWSKATATSRLTPWARACSRKRQRQRAIAGNDAKSVQRLIHSQTLALLLHPGNPFRDGLTSGDLASLLPVNLNNCMENAYPNSLFFQIDRSIASNDFRFLCHPSAGFRRAFRGRIMALR